jgi:hypothetical protein
MAIPGQNAEQGRKFNNGIHGTDEVSLKGSPTVSITVAACKGALFFQVHLYDLFALSASSGVGHKMAKQTEDRNGNQIADKKRCGSVGSPRGGEESKRQGKAENGDENVKHTFLGILGAYFNDLFGSFRGGAQGRGVIQLYVPFDILHGPIGPRRDACIKHR